MISRLFEVNDLSKLHEIQHYEKFERENDQATIWHKNLLALISGSLNWSVGGREGGHPQTFVLSQGVMPNVLIVGAEQ